MHGLGQAALPDYAVTRDECVAAMEKQGLVARGAVKEARVVGVVVALAAGVAGYFISRQVFK